MGFFKRQKKAATTGDSLDDDILREIGARSDLALPRDWIHYLYCATEAGAYTAATAASDDGWDLQRVDHAASGDGWVVIAAQKGVILTRERVVAARVFFEQLAKSVPGGDYDGWEASV